MQGGGDESSRNNGGPGYPRCPRLTAGEPLIECGSAYSHCFHGANPPQVNSAKKLPMKTRISNRWPSRLIAETDLRAAMPEAGALIMPTNRRLIGAVSLKK